MVLDVINLVMCESDIIYKEFNSPPGRRWLRTMLGKYITLKDEKSNDLLIKLYITFTQWVSMRHGPNLYTTYDCQLSFKCFCIAMVKY